MANLRILFRNLVDADQGCTVSASPALVSTLPETFLQTQQRKKCCQTTSTASQEYRFSWATARRINMLALRYHNLTTSAQLAAPRYSDSAFTTLIDANAAANCFAYTGHSRLDVWTEADARLLKSSARYLSLDTNTKSMKATVTDAANPDGYFSISRAFIGEYFEYGYHVPEGGESMMIDDTSDQYDMDDGSVTTNKKEKRRIIELSHDFMLAADWADVLAGFRFAGKDRDVWVSFYPENGTYLEPYWQGAFKVRADGAFGRARGIAAQKKVTLIET